MLYSLAMVFFVLLLHHPITAARKINKQQNKNKFTTQVEAAPQVDNMLHYAA